jgi:hypothetical protein
MSVSSIPMDIVINILGYDNRFVIRGNVISQFNKIDKNDERYNILSHIPKINCGSCDNWLNLPIANTKRQYCLQYIFNSRRSYFMGSLVDYDENNEDNEDNEDEDSEAGDPYELVLYSFSIPK